MLGHKSNISKLCRSCMENGELNLFTTLFETQTVAKLIEKCISSEVSAEDRLPKTICQQCLDKVISCYSFIVNFQKVQVLLKGILEDDKPNELREIDFSETEGLDIDSGIKYESSDDDQPLSAICKKQSLTKCNVPGEDSKYGVLNVKLENNSNLIDTQSNESSDHKLCGELFKSKENFKEPSPRILTKELKCKYCHETFSEKITLSKHLKIIHAEKFGNFTEDVHNKNSKYSSSNKHENSVRKHFCSDCNKYFEFIKHLEKHCRDTGHAIPRRFSCNVCLKKFLSNTRLNDHMRIHNNERPYECNECGMTFTLSSNLKRHKKRHTGEKSYFCEVCGRGFIQKHTLTIHMRLHNGETPYVCELCGKGYRAKPLLHQHMYKHNDIEMQTVKYQKYYLKYGKVKVECQVCKKIITKSALYNHMKVQHGDGLKKFLCNLCGKTYATKMSLDVHMNVHTKKISYDCKICSKSFTHQNYLKTHLMLHSGERPHCCDLCGKTFVQRTHLDRHMRTHTGARPYACTYCDKAFALNENLKVHVRIHTGETPHHCSVCGKGFFNSSSKKKHEANIHQMHRK